MFKDPNFPTNESSFSQTSRSFNMKKMKWMRASEISKNPKFVGDLFAVTPFDVNQGKLRFQKNDYKN